MASPPTRSQGEDGLHRGSPIASRGVPDRSGREWAAAQHRAVLHAHQVARSG